MADTHATAATGSHGGPADTHGGGGHATVKTYLVVAVVLAIITAIEVATLYVPGIPNALLVTSLLVMSAVTIGCGAYLLTRPQAQAVAPTPAAAT